MPKYKRLPNGFGSVVKLSGKRRYPYNARTPVKAYTEEGLPICQSLGCYSTRQQAIDAITSWHENSGVIEYTSKTTLAKVYETYVNDKLKSATPPSKHTLSAMETSFRCLKPLHNRSMSMITLKELQDVVDNSGRKSRSSQTTLITYTRQFFKHALKNDVITKDISQFLENRVKEKTDISEKYYNIDELQVLKDNMQDENVRIVLLMCYSGFRPSAYIDLKIKDGVYVGGIKTAQSKDRQVPIKKELLKYAGEVRLPYKKQIKVFDNVAAKYGIKRLTPHGARHTFKYLCDFSGVDDVTCRMLMGHVLGNDVHSAIYSHRSLDDLKLAIEKLKW